MVAGGAVLAATAGALIDSVMAAGALRADEDRGIDAAEAATLYDIQGLLVGGALAVGLAVLVGATGVLALRTGVLPRWLGIVSVLLVIPLLITPIAWAVTALALLWPLVVSVLLYVRPAEGAAVPATPPTGPAA